MCLKIGHPHAAPRDRDDQDSSACFFVEQGPLDYLTSACRSGSFNPYAKPTVVSFALSRLKAYATLLFEASRDISRLPSAEFPAPHRKPGYGVK
jgi:hypothetical protein